MSSHSCTSMSSSGERGERERESGQQRRGGALEQGGSGGAREGERTSWTLRLSSQACGHISCNQRVVMALLPVLGRLTQRELRVSVRHSCKSHFYPRS